MGEVAPVAFGTVLVLLEMLAQGCFVQVVQLLAALRLLVLLRLYHGHGDELGDGNLLRLGCRILTHLRLDSVVRVWGWVMLKKQTESTGSTFIAERARCCGASLSHKEKRSRRLNHSLRTGIDARFDGATKASGGAR